MFLFIACLWIILSFPFNWISVLLFDLLLRWRLSSENYLSEEESRSMDGGVVVLLKPRAPNLKRFRDAEGRIGMSGRRIERRVSGFGIGIQGNEIRCCCGVRMHDGLLLG